MTDTHAMMVWLGLGAGAAALQARRQAKKKPVVSHGSGRFATEKELRSAGMLDDTPALILGHHLDGRKLGDLVRLAPAVHLVGIAPTGAGKDVSCIGPWSRICPHPTFFIDFKAENAQIAARHRERKFGHRQVFLDPLRLFTDKPDTLNTLDFIPKASRYAIEDIADQAKALAVREERMDGNSAHFMDRAVSQIKAGAAAVVWFGEKPARSFQEVRDILADPGKKKVAMECMQQSQAWGGMLSRIGNDLGAAQGDEAASTSSTVHRLLEWMDTPAMAESTRTSSYDLQEFVDGKADVWVILSPERKESLRGWLRMVTAAHVNAVIRGGIHQSCLKHFVLNEASSLLGNKMESITQALDVGRGFSIRLQFYFQSMGQLKSCFPADGGQTLLSNSSQVFFGVNDYETAEYISKRCGQETIVVESGGSNSGGSKNWNEGPHPTHGGGSSTGRSSNWQHHGRNVLFPDEVLALPPRTAITFVAGMRPIVTRLIRYYEKSWQKRKAKPVAILWVLLVVAAMFALLQ